MRTEEEERGEDREGGKSPEQRCGIEMRCDWGQQLPQDLGYKCKCEDTNSPAQSLHATASSIQEVLWCSVTPPGPAGPGDLGEQPRDRVAEQSCGGHVGLQGHMLSGSWEAITPVGLSGNL